MTHSSPMTVSVSDKIFFNDEYLKVEFRFYIGNNSFTTKNDDMTNVDQTIHVYRHPKYNTDNTYRQTSMDEPLGWVIVLINGIYYEVNCCHHFDRSRGRDSDFDYTQIKLYYFKSLNPRLKVTKTIRIESDFIKLIKLVQEKGDTSPLTIEQIELMVNIQKFIANHPLVDEYWWSQKQIFKTIPNFANDIVLNKLTPVQIHFAFSKYNKNLEYDINVKFHKMIDELITEVIP